MPRSPTKTLVIQLFISSAFTLCAYVALSAEREDNRRRQRSEVLVVQMQLSGSGAAGAAQLNAPPYADGVVVTEGSIYSDWFVVLQGRDN
ncbi:MAG: hypothetical protein AB1556_00230 [Bacillota bacterium]